MSRVRLSLSHRACEDSPSCVPRLPLALSSNWVASIICVFAFSFFGTFLLLLLFLLLLRPTCFGPLLGRIVFPSYRQDLLSNWDNYIMIIHVMLLILNHVTGFFRIDEVVDRELMAPCSQECKDRTPASWLLPGLEAMEVRSMGCW